MSNIAKKEEKPLQFLKGEDGSMKINQEDGFSKLLKMFGLSENASIELSSEIIKEQMSCLIRHGSNEEETDRQFNMIMAQMDACSPEDPIEAMLTMQIIGVHNAMLKSLASVDSNKKEGFLEAQKTYINAVNKLSGSSSKLVNALANHRKKGKQEVTVKHVHVYEGGKAAIGTFNGKGEGD